MGSRTAEDQKSLVIGGIVAVVVLGKGALFGGGDKSGSV
jgi:hypothetical protein